MSKFGDIDAAKAKADVNARIKAVLTLLFQMFTGARNNTANMIQNFIPHLKRTDRDCGSLPFFSKTYDSHKTNKEHILLSMISKVIQVYWSVASGNKEQYTGEFDELTEKLELLEEIAKNGFDEYRVHGKYPNFRLMSKEQVAQLEVAEAQAERDEANRKEDEANQRAADADEAKNLMEQAQGSNVSTSETSPSTQSTQTEVAGTDEQVKSDEEIFQDAAAAANGTASLGESSEEGSPEQESSHDSDDSTKKESTDSSSAPQEGTATTNDDAVKNEVTQQEGSSTASSSDQQAASDSADDQLSTEEADKCGGDCDTCETHACETKDEAPAETEAERVAQQDADGEQYPDVEQLEQTAKDVPPMPEEETQTHPADLTLDNADDDDQEPDHTAEEVEDSGHQ
jgi:hypothetical protein